MKKIIVAVVAILVGINAHAQLGVVAGLTSSKTDLQSAKENFSSISQYHVGVTYKLGIGNVFAVQPSLLYNVKGATVDEINGLKDVDFKTGYLELPVQIQIGLGLGSLARVYGFAEPFVGCAVSNQVINNSIKEKTWENVVNKLEYGVGLGAGVELIKHVQVSVKYYWNMGNVYGNEITLNSIKTTLSQSKCNGVAASVAILF